MVTQDAETFVALGQAMSLAAEEGALDRYGAETLTAALAAAILTGCMELDTYARVHEALARLLELTFQGESRSCQSGDSRGPAAPAEGGADSLGVYLEVVGQAWEKVNGEEAACAQVRNFVQECFDLDWARFGGDSWFRAPIRVSLDQLLQRARVSGLLLVSVRPCAGESLTGVLHDPENASVSTGAGEVVLGWGERRTAMSLFPSD